VARRPGSEEHDPSRREFFKTFSRQTIQSAGAVAGAASEIRRTGLAAARDLLDMDSRAASEAPTASRVATPPPMASAPQETFRSAYRFTGTSLVVLDTRELPARVVTFECTSPNDVAGALRSGAVTPGPVMGQIAAYGVALAVATAGERDLDSRDRYVRTSADAIKAARGDVRAIAPAVARILERYGQTTTDDTAAIKQVLIGEADAIASEATAASAEIGRRWSELVVGDPVNVVLHGDSGPLACGMVGMSTSGIQSLVEAGRSVHVWVTEGAPSGEGTRLTALQLTQLDLAHTVITDTAIGWLFANRKVDAVVLRGDTVTGNGDAVSSLGSLSVAGLAVDAHVPVHVVAPETSWNRVARDASGLALDIRSAAELGSASRARLSPPFDIVPARLVSAYISERAVVSPPFKQPR
jgi:methylthioribose-1-phosphate isomerase